MTFSPSAVPSTMLPWPSFASTLSGKLEKLPELCHYAQGQRLTSARASAGKLRSWSRTWRRKKYADDSFADEKGRALVWVGQEARPQASRIAEVRDLVERKSWDRAHVTDASWTKHLADNALLADRSTSRTSTSKRTLSCRKPTGTQF